MDNDNHNRSRMDREYDADAAQDQLLAASTSSAAATANARSGVTSPTISTQAATFRHHARPAANTTFTDTDHLTTAG